jgi:hypothetical protein
MLKKSSDDNDFIRNEMQSKAQSARFGINKLYSTRSFFTGLAGEIDSELTK